MNIQSRLELLQARLGPFTNYRAWSNKLGLKPGTLHRWLNDPTYEPMDNRIRARLGLPRLVLVPESLLSITQVGNPKGIITVELYEESKDMDTRTHSLYETEASGKAPLQREAIVAHLKENGPTTRNEIDRAFPWIRLSSVCARVNELIKDKVLVEIQGRTVVDPITRRRCKLVKYNEPAQPRLLT